LVLRRKWGFLFKGVSDVRSPACREKGGWEREREKEGEGRDCDSLGEKQVMEPPDSKGKRGGRGKKKTIDVLGGRRSAVNARQPKKKKKKKPQKKKKKPPQRKKPPKGGDN